MRIKLNRWQGIGILLSVIWFIGIAGYMGYILYNEKRDDVVHGRLAEVRSLCEQNVKDPLNPAAELDPSISVRKRCFNEARSNFAKNMLAIGFGTVVFGWFVVWFGIGVTRWIRRGFA